MPGIASTLDAVTQARIERVWAELEARFGVPATVIHRPHVTFQLAGGYEDLSRVEAVVAGVAASTAPVEAVTSGGVGVFRNPRATVVYLPLERGEALTALHARLSAGVAPLASGVPAHFDAARWAPHLSLAVLEAGRAWPEEDIVASVRDAGARRWAVRLESLVVMRDAGGARGDWAVHALRGGRAR